MTQEAFAERAGLKYKHYQAVEAGRKPNIQFETVTKMARACGLELWELLHFDHQPDALAEPQTPYGTAKTKKGAPATSPKRPRQTSRRRSAGRKG